LYDPIPSGIAIDEAIHAIFQNINAGPNWVANEFARAGKFGKG
jgi:hypothetical protein